jgi:NAD(P)-dependent dehydrogenase (short-subunit alcohol dehydrogenase family)
MQLHLASSQQSKTDICCSTIPGQLTNRGDAIIKKVPQVRFGNPDELTGALVWLLSESSSFSTGTIITFKGGFDVYIGI